MISDHLIETSRNGFAEMVFSLAIQGALNKLQKRHNAAIVSDDLFNRYLSFYPLVITHLSSKCFMHCIINIEVGF